MDSKYICEQLKEHLLLCNNTNKSNVYAVFNESEKYVFGLKEPYSKNVVTRQTAIYIIMGIAGLRRYLESESLQMKRGK